MTDLDGFHLHVRVETADGPLTGVPIPAHDARRSKNDEQCEAAMAIEPRYPYEDPHVPVEDRISDLIGRMSRTDKAALIFHSEVSVGYVDGSDHWGRACAGTLLRERGITHFLGQGTPRDGRDITQWHNRLQEIALELPLRIPVTLSSDPRHSVTDNPLTSQAAGAFSRWPESLGIAAIGSEKTAYEQGEVVGREYLAAGIRVALHPQVDLSTEYRWARIVQTYGEDADLTSRLAVAYFQGLQGDGGAESVAAMAKHFPGGGPQKDGLDPHFRDGREQVYPGDRFDYHLAPFVALIEAGLPQIMPYYGMPVGTEWEEVGFAYNKGIVTELLRQRLGFDGIVCTDFGVITGMGDTFPAKAWGVEHLSREQRVTRLLDSGVDQFGGEKDVSVLLDALSSGSVTEQQLEQPVRRLLREKFRLGLFDGDRVIDPERANTVIGSAAHQALGVRAQQRSLVLLKNDAGVDGLPLLPLSPGIRVFVDGVEPSAFEGFASVVTHPAEADVAVVRTRTPDYADPAMHFLGSMHKGSLEFRPEDRERIRTIAEQVPTVLDVYLDRPAVLTDVLSPTAVFASFGTDDRPFVEVLFGEAGPEGSLPVELPRSMAAVKASRTDVPFDTADPLYRFGHGLRYERSAAERTDEA
ncbi:glycoside hydrolase family 3 protein [Streptomyces sp. NBC_01235]|uniref:glycoside hydrolase family 3 protein n=1 Tax=Streptomyces sp. NBC_01235 TaxID=2903788 RepID=UPI002E1486E4|nr:glycoside hydrolase family 3 C-terminal domain-containing protein [Streptomyces sp. NBC_01235]